MKYILILLISSLFFKLSLKSQTKSYVPEQALKSVVLLEKEINNIYYPHGTGFLMLSYDNEKPLIVVTNEHVLRNRFIYITVPADSALIKYMTKNKYSSITFKTQTWTFEGNKLRLKYELIPDSTFVYDKELDIAAFKINIGNSVDVGDSASMKIAKVSGIGKSVVRLKKDVPLGIGVIFIGFPFSIGTEHGWYYNGYFTKEFSEEIPTPLVREGIVAWKSSNNDIFLTDGFSYGGNSGGPIFIKDEFGNDPYFIGIISGHLPSEKTDNAGLAICIWSDKIIELIKTLK